MTANALLPHRSVPADAQVRADHKVGISLIEAAARYHVKPASLYAHWRRLGLLGAGRLGGTTRVRRLLEVPANDLDGTLDAEAINGDILGSESKPELDMEAILDACVVNRDAYRNAVDRQQAARGRRHVLALVPTVTCD